MARVRPSMGMHNLGRGKQAIESKYVSHCKICRHGIYQDAAPYRFVTGRVLGLVHDACIEETP